MRSCRRAKLVPKGVKADRDRRSYQNHRAKRIAAAVEWARANGHKHQRAYKARKLEAEGDGHSILEIAVRDNWTCHICSGSVTRENWTEDHLFPFSWGGDHVRENVRLAHHACNSSRNDHVFVGALAERLRDDDDFCTLAIELFSLGGYRIITAYPEDYLDALLRWGTKHGLPVATQPMATHRCHLNAFALWHENSHPEPCYKIATGWALKDGLWHQHSWCEHNEQIVETTVEREVYWGMTLSDEEAITFFRG